jgi:hypothetical protein
MKTMKGPAIFLAQFAGDATPFNNLANIVGWGRGPWLHAVAELGHAPV